MLWLKSKKMIFMIKKSYLHALKYSYKNCSSNEMGISRKFCQRASNVFFFLSFFKIMREDPNTINSRPSAASQRNAI